MGDGDDEVEDDLVLNDDRIDEDDTSDLHPWKKQVNRDTHSLISYFLILFI